MLLWLLMCMTCSVMGADKDRVSEAQRAANETQRAALVAQFNQKYDDPKKADIHYKFLRKGPAHSVVFDEAAKFAYGFAHGKKQYNIYRCAYHDLHMQVTGKVRVPVVAKNGMWSWYADTNKRTLACCEVQHRNEITFIGYSPEKMIIVKRPMQLISYRCRVEEDSIICETSTDCHQPWEVFVTIKDSGAYDANGTVIGDTQWQTLDFKRCAIDQ
jgi:hypothetical protein